MGIYLGVLAEFFTDPLYLFPDQRPNAGVSVTIKALDHIPFEWKTVDSECPLID